MKIKEFIKPTIAKIIITIILLFIPFYKQTICPFSPPCFKMWYSLYSIIIEIIKTQNNGKIILIFLIFFIITYIISLILILIYKKIRK
ncbi:MAG: hypothetical protein KKF48_01180 [Nanoarchaeota archaeon]|nr:hypothetical protein [Nanoarchaeota archaeon]